MSKIIAVVEGSTEQTFVREVLAPWLWRKSQVELVASTAGKPGKKGGNVYERVKGDLINHLNNPHFAVVTTFFDYYGMPPKWPGRKQASKKSHANKPLTVEKAIRDDIESDVGSELISRFLPYIQMHEFEALLFSEPSALSEVMQDESSRAKLIAIRKKFQTPEEINDSPHTAPSKRVEGIFRHFRKAFHGVLAAKRITIEKMMLECPHFKEWVTALESFSDSK